MASYEDSLLLFPLVLLVMLPLALPAQQKGKGAPAKPRDPRPAGRMASRISAESGRPRAWPTSPRTKPAARA